MIKFVLLVIFSTYIMGQENFEKPNPCNHPLIKLAKEKGLEDRYLSRILLSLDV